MKLVHLYEVHDITRFQRTNANMHIQILTSGKISSEPEKKYV